MITNTFHFEDDSPFGSDAGIENNGPGLVTRLQTFYNTLGQTLLSGLVDGTGTVRLYRMDDPLPRRPKLEAPITYSTVSVNGFPAEVAMVLSLRAAAASGQNAARRRGRVYIGPITAAAATSPTGTMTDNRPTQNAMDALIQAAHVMARGATGTFRLAVFSPTTAGANTSADAAWNDVVRVSVDNAWDTVRSRGARASLRRGANLGGTLAITAGA